MAETWFELLLRDATPEELQQHGAGLPGPAAERETTHALRLSMVLRDQARRASELAALNDIAISLATLRAPDELLPEIVGQARRLLGADLAYLGLIEENRLRLKVTSGALTPELVGLDLPLHVGLVGEVIEHAAPRWTADYRADRRFRHDETADAAAGVENMRGLLGVPLRLRGRVLGALFAGKRQERDFTEHEVTLASALAAHAAIAIENARSVAELAETNEQLARRTRELEQTLRWDQRLTRVVLGGGGVEDLLAEIRSATRGAVRFVPGRGGDGALVQPVVAGQREFGALVLEREPSPDDRLVLERAAPALALALLAEQSAAEASRRTRAALLVDLLTASSARPQDMRQAGLDAEADYTVLVIDGTRAQVEQLPLLRNAFLAEYGGRLVAVAPAAEPGRVRREWPADGPAAGVAGPARGQAALSRCFTEARQILGALTALGRRGEAATASQLGLYRILLDHTGRRDLEQAFDEQLGPVLVEERRRGVPLLETLRVFLDEGRRPRAAATALAIHVNTLYQRLRTLDGLLGEGWREPGRALELQLLLRLRDLTREQY
ncbi:DNA-binding PucR family transcriptional regulator [Amycolatopsis bartoniae]|uniref:CdaR family transcriptional regulator n=1 Tax=Amycolatopsis bartoniae TaxID=941986 RepID=A0A8H9M9B4_9PSEU|nr:GAF domain-containing protein [Amycolatopsis bartoniae]MBB2937702.1 DNA-binding PucR family transcriptional regulator [Amycolatopsis bartoniae]TVT08210.1 GAF domain-containing protein [Amycolatopsis bartoniae]GHF40038.1 CdaR family transcriptional regulator [Amycolatopsis bartoniae]